MSCVLEESGVIDLDVQCARHRVRQPGRIDGHTELGVGEGTVYWLVHGFAKDRIGREAVSRYAPAAD
jgi:hypothetical protein